MNTGASLGPELNCLEERQRREAEGGYMESSVSKVEVD